MDHESIHISRAIRNYLYDHSINSGNKDIGRRFYIIREDAALKLNDITRGTGLEEHGINNANLIFWTTPTPVLYEQIIVRGEGSPRIWRGGGQDRPLSGRAPNEKFIVDEPSCHDYVNWGKINRPFAQAKFEALYNRLLSSCTVRPVRSGLFCWRKPRTSPANTGDHRTGLALPVRPEYVHSGDRGRTH